MQAQLAQADLNLKLGQDQLAWAKEQYAKDSVISDKVVDSFLETMDATRAHAEADRKRYDDTFVPLQDEYIQRAKDAGTDEKRDLNMGRAQADVATQFETARRAAQADLESYGINPSATRFQALDIGTRSQQAAAMAAAGTNASLQTDATANDMLLKAAGLGDNLPAQALSEYGVSGNSGSGAAGTTQGNTTTGANTMGTSTQYNTIGAGSLSGAANTMNAGYQNQLGEYKANQDSSSGWGQALGLIGGMAMKKFGFEDGGAVPASISPSRGAVPDDVDARLTAGEFIVPSEAVKWYGEKHFHGLVEKAKKERGAIPTLSDDAARPLPYSAAPKEAALPLG